MLKAHLYIGFRKSHSFRVSLPFQLTESTVKIHITNHTIEKINYSYTYYIAPTFQGEKKLSFSKYDIQRLTCHTVIYT